MKWQTFKIITQHKKRILFDAATTEGTDGSTDPSPSTDPNNYLAPKINEISLIQWLLIAALVVSIGLLFVSVAKQSKSL